jgi:predicted DNA-binding transcriptional regulator AlpA
MLNVNTPLTRKDLRIFLSVEERGLGRALRDLGIPLRGGTTRWPVVWRALGLAAEQDPSLHDDLTAKLLTARAVADLVGVTDPSIVYRWEKGKVPANTPPFPASIDLSNGRKDARAKRWRRAEVLAWHTDKPLPRYARPAPAFGALTPTP